MALAVDPLTITDHASRFLLACESLSSTREDYAFTVLERLFRERGLPASIWLVSFMEYDLGYFDLETRVLDPLENPFDPKV